MHLNPRDAAKLGYLWLHGGSWEGTPVVSQSWVKASIQPQVRASETDDYGYGWWITRQSAVGGEFNASGRGGQVIRVHAALNAVIVTTGGGFEPGEATDPLAGAVVDLKQPLPPNAAGKARLDSTLTALLQPLPAGRIGRLPETAARISGTTYVFESNPALIQSVRLDFDGPAEARMTVRLFDGRAYVDSPIGLDGVYRMSQCDYGLAVGQRGVWQDEQTFALERDEIANLNAGVYRLRFDAMRLLVLAKEQTHEANVEFEGSVQSP
jgi:hypothetical protein